MSNFLKVGDLSDHLVKTIRDVIKDFAIGFWDWSGEEKDEPHLRGSGTLISAFGKFAVLTAHHVVEKLPSTGRLGLLIDQSTTPLNIDISGLSYVKLARGGLDSEGPDLGLVIIGPEISGTLKARKRFFDLERHSERFLIHSIEPSNGVWALNGFVNEWSHTTWADEGAPNRRRFVNYSFLGGPDIEPAIGEFDYLRYPVSLGSANQAPFSFKGVSGGGLWLIELENADGEIKSKAPLLCGVAFYQPPEPSLTS